MKFIDADQVHRYLDYPALIAGLDRSHKEDTHLMDDLLLGQSIDTNVTNHLLIRAAWQYNQAVGMKLVTIFPNNPNEAHGLPAVQAVYVLFDGVDGKPMAAIDGTALTYRKTAADSALGSKYLARKDVSHMLMVGAGAMAPHLIQAHCAACPSIEHVAIWNRSPKRAHAITETLKLDKVSLNTQEDLEQGVRDADLVSCATMTKEPIIKGTWLTPGTHLDLVGAFTKDMRETDDEAFRRASVFVDSRKTTIGEIGEIVMPMESGAITENDILADHYDLCRGKYKGRKTVDEITLLKNGGGGHLDLMTARFLLEQVG